MSMFKLKNKTGSDSIQDWANDFTFPNNTAIDLLAPGTYGESEIAYNLGFCLDDILGIKGGSYFDNIVSLIRTSNWCINDGDSDLNKEDSLYILKYGKSPISKTKVDFSGNSGAAFESHNFMNTDNWTDGESKFTIAPIAGKNLYLTGSKVLVSDGCSADDDFYFRVFMDYEVAPGIVQNIMVREDSYSSVEALMPGAKQLFTSPIIGNQDGRGSRALTHIIYHYVEPIILKSSLNMRIEIGFRNNKIPIKKDQLLQVRVDAVSIKE